MAFQSDQANLQGWTDDVWGWVKTGADWINRAGGTAQNTGTAIQNAGANLQNVTSWRLDGKTVVIGALIAGGLVYATRRRR